MQEFILISILWLNPATVNLTASTFQIEAFCRQAQQQVIQRSSGGQNQQAFCLQTSPQPCIISAHPTGHGMSAEALKNHEPWDGGPSPAAVERAMARAEVFADHVGI